MPTCDRCGTENPAGARFCNACGAALAAAAPPAETRKTVSVLFCDVVDSTPLGERLDPEALHRMMSRYFDTIRSVVERHGGTVEKFIGDAVMAVFGVPTVHEDDALRAVRSAAEIREALAGLNRQLEEDHGLQLRIRVGVSTGEVAAGNTSAGQSFVAGDTVVLAQRLESAAHASEILIAEPTFRLVRDAVLAEPAGPLELKGKAAPVPAWRVLAVLPDMPAVRRRLDAELVGRRRELAFLEEAFARSVRERACRLVTVLGAAGVGKSRLVRELVSTLAGRARVLAGRCLPYGEDITFFPLAELVRQAAGITLDLSGREAEDRIARLLAGEPKAPLVAERLAAATGVGEATASNEEIFWAARKMLEALGRRQPLLLVLDDLHWAAPTFLDLLEHTAEWTRDSAILLVGLARPELLEERPAWAEERPGASSLLLEPLDSGESERLIGNLLGPGELDPAVRGRIVEAAGGNPLFVEEVLAMLIDRGALEQVNGGWRARADLGTIDVPATIQAIVAARLDRLPRRERAVIERAAVVGKIFRRSAVAHLSNEDDPTDFDPPLAALVEKGLIRPARSSFAGDQAFRFHHLLVRDAAYQGIPKGTRAHLHERYAHWFEGAARDRLREFEEIIGYHLEQGFTFRQELGLVDDASRAAAARGGEHLGSAGRRALQRGDARAAVALFTRAGSLFPADHQARVEILPELGSALIRAGDFERAETVLDEALDRAAAAGDDRLRLRAVIDREFLRSFTEPGSADELRRTAESVIPRLEELGDELGLAKAWWLLSEAHVTAGRWAARAGALERALEHARRSGARSEAASITGLLAQALCYGPEPVDRAISRCEGFLAEAGADRSLESGVAGTLALLRAMRGDFDEARALWAQAAAIDEGLGLSYRRAARSLVPATVEMLAGDPAAAVHELRSGYEALEAMGGRGARSTLAAFLSEALYADGRYAEAERFTELSEQAAAEDDLVTQVVWRATRAKVLARRGDHARAEELAREAVSLTGESDFLELEAAALEGLAEVLRLAGRPEEAAPLLEGAVELHERKGNVVAARTVAATLSRAL